jgi:hypothetical protein
MRLSDIDQGSQGDAELFREATDTSTLKDFENPKIPVPPAETDLKTQPRGEDGRFQKTEKPEPEPPGGGQIPSGRLREESDARRRAEQEILDLRAKIAAYEVQRQQPQQPAPRKLDIFDDPSGFVKQEMYPVLQQMDAHYRYQMEKQSVSNAQRLYGNEMVDQAYNAMALGLRSGDATAKAVLDNAQVSHDPYGMITQWYIDRQTLNTIGGDLETYKKQVLAEAMKDPEYQRQVFNAMRGQATQQVVRPVQQVANPSPTYPPSVSDIGAAVGGEELIQDASDQALFRAAVSAKRRPTGLR